MKTAIRIAAYVGIIALVLWDRVPRIPEEP